MIRELKLLSLHTFLCKKNKNYNNKMSGLIGKKLGMTNVFDTKGRSVGCTVIQAGPCYVTQIKDRDKDGYRSIQLAYDDLNPKRYQNL